MRLGSRCSRVAVVAIAALTTLTWSSRSDAATQKREWVAVGDSYSAGVGGSGALSGGSCSQDVAHSYSSRALTGLSQYSGVYNYENLACLGAKSSDQLTDSILSTINRKQPEIVTLTIGGNDLGF
jgi:lysophospholipase L1-like esterase